MDQTLPGHVPPVTANLKPIGRLPATNQLYLAVGLRLPNKAALQNFLDQIYDPKNPNFRHYLTPEQFTDTFGPTPEDYQAVLDFAKANGLAISGTHPNRLLVDVTGSVADIEKALHVTMLVFQHPTEARSFYAPDVEPSLDSARPVLHISGLNNYNLPRPLSHFATNQMPTAVGSGPGGNYIGYDFRNAYLPNVALTGVGQYVGLLEFDDYYHPTPDDVALYQSTFMRPNPNLIPTIIPVDGGVSTPNQSGGALEVALDIDMAIAMAPGLSGVFVYEAPLPLNAYPWLTSAAIDDILSAMANPIRARQLSSSWLIDDTDPNADNLYLEYAAQGQSFFQASGDLGAYGQNGVTCPVYLHWADSPYITIVGGTTLTTSSAGGPWTGETVWNNVTYGYSSGGGKSGIYAIPYWQQGINMSANLGSTSMRNIPDVALTADQIAIYYDGNPWQNVMGTSAAAPLWAGFAALANQNAASNGKAPIGFFNPAVYALGKSMDYTIFFHDITTGNNNNNCYSFPAVTGYDLSTGWGSPTPNLLYNLLYPDCPLTPSGLVSWWAAEGNTLDNENNNNGVAEGNLQYVPGEVNQAFWLNGWNADVRAPASPSLDVGSGSGFTVEAWIEPTVFAYSQPIVQWRDPANQFWRVSFNVEGGAELSVWMINPTDGSSHTLWTPSVLSTWVWQHVALTYDNTSGTASLYVNGMRMAQGNLGISRPTTTGPVYLGKYLWGSNVIWFSGGMDEASVYNRVLTDDEIMAIWNARASGKCCPSCG